MLEDLASFRLYWEQKLAAASAELSNESGYKLLYCPWKTLATASVAFISLNPGRAPQGVEMCSVSEERGNAYEIEREITVSPINEQFLALAKMLDMRPIEILCGVAVPFRSNGWSDLSPKQREIGLTLGYEFWSTVLTECEMRLVVLSAGAAAGGRLLRRMNAKRVETIASGWGNVKLRTYRTATNARIVVLPHLSRFKVFSRNECLVPLRRALVDN